MMRATRILIAILFFMPMLASSLCAQLVIEAETMNIDPSLGGPEPPGLKIWSTGKASLSFDVPSLGEYRVEVVARGDSAQDVFPIMNVTLDGFSLGVPISVNGSWQTYVVTTWSLTAGTHVLAIEFTNDYYDGIEDRNLYVDTSNFWHGILTPVIVTPGKFKMEWNPKTEPADLVGFKVYRSEQESTFGAQLGTVPQPATVFEDLTAQAGHTYYYTVTAYTLTNESGHSNIVVTAVLSNVALPPAPTNLRRLP